MGRALGSEEKYENKKKKSGIVGLIIGIIISIGVFFALVTLESKMVAPNGTKKVYIATENIKKGTIIETSEEFNKLFKLGNVNSDLVIEGAISEGKEATIIGNLITIDLLKSEQISSEKVIKKDSILASFTNPREISIKGTDIADVVGGILREGDLINIEVIDSVDNSVETVQKNVYIDKVFSSDGVKIEQTNDTLAALTINVLIEESEEVAFKEKLAKGGIKVSKVVNTDYKIEK